MPVTAPPADFEVLQPEVVTQVHTHHAHLTNLQALRLVATNWLPSLAIFHLREKLHFWVA